MKLHLENKTETEVVVSITATEEELSKIKQKVLKVLAPQVKVAGFRAGKVPVEVAQKHIDDQTMQTEFLNEAINTLYIAAIKEEKLRPVAQPKVEVKKFVPFSVLEIDLEIGVVGKVTLPDYKKVTSVREKVAIKKADIDEVLDNLATRLAEKNEVQRAAKLGDETIIDFKGTDKKGEAIAGADGADFPLTLGSKQFIPGFEEEVVGMKAGEEKTFTVTFPENYGAKHLQKAKVTFAVTVKKVNEIVKPSYDDEFAAKIGPFSSLDELKEDIKHQLEAEKKNNIERDYENALVNELSDKTKVAIPDSLIDEQKDMIMQELRQNVMQRGMTMQEYIDSRGAKDEEAYINDEVIPEAIRRIKAGLLLSEIGDKEGISVSDGELQQRINELKEQYKDPQMQEELDKSENQREIRARLRSEKVLEFLKK